ncbi:peroxiredoxin family protein [Muriicola sp. Z0-33]|uniref:peroxiredoxin family protein n=1 Tax=Muriicola sp. Z0-33 TaxID=2816957 RepID=UPI002237B99C|nr:TlpA disulfide reductase family protein [Muriicola sp. Z0-33]MCW5516581.1 TlpA family protein disulfide reductase [Muriicola sp. Z0-33]
MVKKIILVFVFIGFFGCETVKKDQLKQGSWLAHLEVMDGEKLPFNFNLSKVDESFVMEVYNADEVITINDIEIKQDSIYIRMSVFEGYIAGTYTQESVEGSYIKESLDRVVPFKAAYGAAPRFTSAHPGTQDISGIWETEFIPDDDDPYIAKGIFTQNKQLVKGTFRTTTGDYRYLEGIVDGDSLKLSTFDGAHAFLFTARVTDSTLNGAFYSGNHSKEIFTAVRNEDFELPDETTLTYLKDGYDTFEFSFPNEAGELISLGDPEFQGKATVVQIMGTWCPNCLDESKFLVDYLKKNNNPNLKVIALAFEYARTKEGAFKGIQRLKDRLGVEYPVLLAQYGTSNKSKANEKLPMLNHVLSYPTTIFIDKKGKVRKIHTGFNGPATGDKYLEFKLEFDTFIKELLDE